MIMVAFTEFRKNASKLVTEVENGERLVLTRHGKPVAEIVPIAESPTPSPSWKRPDLRLALRGNSLSAAILAARAQAD
ncbi:MAG: type II toxin-antitoxin system prevent-host-death family antitoxin [Candidatus Latescibacteria bacterium]|nr:type II toxin-antitoxin system prevent-host-death family antitoxin [Candidatus Latescibacterota bacterium]